MEVPGTVTEMRTVGIVTGGHFLSHFYILAFPPLFPLFRSEFAVNNTQLGLVVSVISIAMLLQVPVGGFVDRLGAKWIFVAGIAVTSLGVLLAGTASGYLALVAFATLSGVGQAAFHPADYPLIETVSADERRGRNFSVHTFGGYVGFATAPLVVGGLGLTLGWRPALLVTGAVGLAYAAFAAVALEPVYEATVDGDETDGDSTLRATLARPGILALSLFFLLSTVSGKGIQSFTPILAVDGFGLSEAVGNATLSVFFTATALAVLVGGYFADRADPGRIIAVATTLAALTLFVAVGPVVAVGQTVLLALFALAGVGYGMIFASRDRLVSEYSAAGSTGSSFGVVFTASSLGALTSPILLGAVIDVSTTMLAFGLVGGFFLASAVVAWHLRAG